MNLMSLRVEFRARRPAALVCLLLLMSLALSCTRMESGDRGGAPAVDLLARLGAGPGDGEIRDEAGGSFRRHLAVVRRGKREDAAVLTAPITVRAALAGLSGTYELSCLAAPVFNIGDGLEMSIDLEDGSGRRTIFRRSFDSGRRAADRDWIPLRIPLELEGNEDSFLEITVSGGPQGDLVADWLALARLELAPR